MPATLGWLDHDVEERDRMHRILALFRAQETRDELGVGVIRDLIADELFPGTSTIQTRLRYMLFVPWIYRELEEERWSSREIAREARRREVELVKGLLKSDDTTGVFGKRAGGDLERLPSSVYWAGLGHWGIRRFDGSQEEYHSLIDEMYRRRDDHRRGQQSAKGRGEGDDSVGAPSGVTWHPKLPAPPKGFPEDASIGLTAEEANFIQDQVTTTKEDSLLVKLFARKPADVEFPWEHPDQASFSTEHRQLLHDGRMFSDLMYGASILYNLMLAEKAKNQVLIDEHRQRASEWPSSPDFSSLRAWSFDWATRLEMGQGQRISPHTLDFCRQWLSLVLNSEGKLFDLNEARAFIRSREMRLKGSRSRFGNQRALDQWSGYAGLYRMNYRWRNVQAFVRDLHDALAGGKGEA